MCNTFVLPGANGSLPKFSGQADHRRSIRLRGYDYSKEGLYYITLCVNHHACLFGQVVNRKMILNDAGNMVQDHWNRLPGRFGNICI